MVVAIQTADELGAWTTWQAAPGTTTSEAWRLVGDRRQALRVGDTVPDDQPIITRRARVRIEVAGSGTITLYDDSETQLADHGQIGRASGRERVS